MSNKSKQHGDNSGRTKDQWLPHKDWRVYLGVALMLVAMFVYLATMDESLRPNGQVAQPVPAASGQ
jgi:hypothetical protein